MKLADRFSQLERSPLTDPRALGVSAAIHAVILIVLSLMVFGISMPERRQSPSMITAQIGPVDNRASGDPGGGSGKPASPNRFSRLTADPVVEARAGEGLARSLLSDLLPSRDHGQSREPEPSGPATTGPGLFPGEFAAGSGGGQGGGIGSGTGPGTEFFGTSERATSFAFVIDDSGSMFHRDALKIAKAELWKSLERLPPDARFAVIFYNMKPTVLPDAQGRSGLMFATIENKNFIRERMAKIDAEGGTEHASALRAAIALKPEVIYFLTDAETMDQEDAKAIRAECGAIRIQAIEFGDGPSGSGSHALRSLAIGTGGMLRHIDLSKK